MVNKFNDSFRYSHKRSTGQGIVGRLYEGLKSDYKVFLDSEAKFKIHGNLLIKFYVVKLTFLVQQLQNLY